VRDNISEADFRKQRPDHIHAGLVGRLDQVKRIDLFLQMAAAICSNPGNKLWHFHIFGEGSLADSLQGQAQQLGITPSVTFHGHRLDIQNCIAALDVMVMTSDHEGLPMAALESIALNTPLVAHKVGGLSEILSDYPALLVADHSPEGYQKAVAAALKMHNTELKLHPRFSAPENANGTLTLYQQLACG
jgi:glycosyltransferase involved in cell wall biosynthesis